MHSLSVFHRALFQVCQIAVVYFQDWHIYVEAVRGVRAWVPRFAPWEAGEDAITLIVRLGGRLEHGFTRGGPGRT